MQMKSRRKIRKTIILKYNLCLDSNNHLQSVDIG